MHSFNKTKIVAPEMVLTKLGINIGKTNAKGYWALRCPFHDDTKPSLNLHSISGHYKCHSCGEKGGGVLDFYIKVTGKQFKEAAKDLGAWEVRS